MIGLSPGCIWEFSLVSIKVFFFPWEGKACYKHEKRVKQSCFLDPQTSAVAKLQKGHRWLELILGDAMRRTTCWAQNGPLPCHDKQLVGEKRKGKLINAAAHAGFLFQVNNTIIVQQGLWHGSLGGGWLFCKINNLENRFLRFLARMSNVGWLYASFKNNSTLPCKACK